jgi:hypothetical protein
MFFSFPEDARWNADRQAVEFGVGIGEYEGTVRVPRQVFQRLLDGAVPRKAAWQPTICNGPGSSWWQSGSCGTGSSAMTATSK